MLVIAAYVLVGKLMLMMADGHVMAAALAVGVGLPMWYLLTGCLALLGRVMLKHTAAGLGDEPLPTITDLNPFQSGPAPGLFAVLLLAVLTWWSLGPQPSVMLLIAAVLVPILWLGGALESSPLSFLEPRRLAHLLRGLHLYLPLVLLTLAGGIGWFTYVLLWDHGILQLAASGYALLLANALCGQILYQQRGALGLVTERSPEQALAAELKARSQALDELLMALHRLCQSGNLATAVERLEQWVVEAPEEERDVTVHERLTQFQDERLFLEHGVRYLQRLAASGQPRKAWAVLKECLEHDDRFRPPDPATLLALTRLADPGDAAVVNQVLSDFATAYPESPLAADAAFRRARVCIERLGDPTTGLELLREIARDHPQFARSNAFLRYQRRLRVRDPGAPS